MATKQKQHSSAAYITARRVLNTFLKHQRPIRLEFEDWNEAYRLRSNIYKFLKAHQKDLTTQAELVEDVVELAGLTNPYKDIVMQLKPPSRPGPSAKPITTTLTITDTALFIDTVGRVLDDETGEPVELEDD